MRRWNDDDTTSLADSEYSATTGRTGDASDDDDETRSVDSYASYQSTPRGDEGARRWSGAGTGSHRRVSQMSHRRPHESLRALEAANNTGWNDAATIQAELCSKVDM